MNRTFMLGTIALLLLASTDVAKADEHAVTYHLFGMSHAERESDLKEAVSQIPVILSYEFDQNRSEVTFHLEPRDLYRPEELAKPSADNVVNDQTTMHRLDEQLRRVSKSTFSISQRSTVADDKLSRIEIAVNPLDCKACRLGVYSIVAKSEGVSRAYVSTEPSLVVAWIDSAVVDREALVKKLEEKQVPLP